MDKTFVYPDKDFEKINTYHSYFLNEISTATRNLESVPKNATIRLEYVKCGKKNCRKCTKNEYYHKRYNYHHQHGPYYFSYWRDKTNNGKLKKKYIGNHLPVPYELIELVN